MKMQGVLVPDKTPKEYYYKVSQENAAIPASASICQKRDPLDLESDLEYH